MKGHDTYMKLNQNTNYIMFQQGESTFSFLPSGDIFEFTYGNFLVNQFQGSAKEGSANNIWLRIYKDNNLNVYPLLGLLSGSRILKGENTLTFSGAVENILYTVTFYGAAEGIWFWNIELDGNSETVDVVYGQDIGVAAKGGVLTNELYMAQYLGHTAFEAENGYLICSRQNQAQGDQFPYLQQGMIKGKSVGFSTDGMQFFGLSYKATQKPEALEGDLPNKNYQFEFSYTALQSEKFSLNGKQSITFYGLFHPTHEDAVRGLEFIDKVKTAFESFQNQNEKTELIAPINIRKEFGMPYISPQWNENDVNQVFASRKLEERENGKLLSFFTDSHAHVVLQQKELLMERPHGTIITTKMNMEAVDNHLITSTNYIYGLFNGQTTAGNTSFHKLISTPRGLLNVLKNYGQRMYVKLGEQYRMLTLPAAYEMGMNYSRWYYTLPDDTLVVSSFAVAKQMDIVLEVKSATGKAYDFIITNQLVMGENEFQAPVQLEEINGENKILRITPDEEKWWENPYPGLHYDIQMPGINYTWSDDRIFFEDGESRNGTLLTLSVNGINNFQLIIQGRLEQQEPKSTTPYSFETEWSKFQDFYKTLNGGFHLEKDGMGKNEIEKLNETAWWYSHNAMVHFAVPHGLEQPGGAAWGTRDVCQGPMEYFLTMQNYKLARAVLLQIFSHQTWETQEWPQWFMFDKYSMNAGECHGDVVLWPLKAMGDYLKASGDHSILKEVIPYLNSEDGNVSDKRETVLEHIKRAVSTIEARFLEGTALISYAGGDWDDTLQPADEGMKERLVSAWTEALAYESLTQLGQVLKPVDEAYAEKLSNIAVRMRNAFHELLIKDGVITGFLSCEEDGAFNYMLHPNDHTTGMKYRLLPMTRSIIAELVSKPQAERNVQLIDEHLNCPDGVRLMDKPARYDGGVSHLFRRAEQASNVGREISLQYTHAHIRYIEAMAKLGLSDRVWEALFQINPINIKEAVPNALSRQSNMYFSSSDGYYMDRYDYSENFEKLRDGSVDVRGGWRLYSSGPGIYMHQLVSNVLGIRFLKEGLFIDPVLPHEMDSLRFSFTCFGEETTFVYHVKETRNGDMEIMRNCHPLNGVIHLSPYRNSGIRISKEEFLKESGEIHIVLS
jgi:1,2-beta-oligoglucan phosphorylase